MTTEAEIITELGNLNQQAIWKGLSGRDKLFITMLSLIAGSSGGGGSAGTTSITQAEVKAAIESATNLDQLEALLENLGTYVDGLEALNTTLNTYVDGIEGLETAIRDRLNAVSFATSALQTAGNNSLASIDTKTGAAYQSVATIQRAANTTAYIANDVYGAAFELPNFAAAGGHVILSSVRMEFYLSAIPSGMAGFSLALYSAPPSVIADNGAFNIPVGDRFPVLLTPVPIDLGAPSLAIGGGLVVLSADNLNLQIKTAAGQTSVWGRTITRGAFTPAASGETATIVTYCLGA